MIVRLYRKCSDTVRSIGYRGPHATRRKEKQLTELQLLRMLNGVI